MANEFNIKITNTDDIKNLVGDIVAGKADPIGSAETLDRLKKVEEAALTQKKDSIDRNELGKISRSIYDFRDSIEDYHIILGHESLIKKGKKYNNGISKGRIINW